MPIVKMLELSTAHMPCEDPGFGDIRVSEHKYGYTVFVCDYKNLDIPEWLRPILEKAVAEGCTIIHFDADAEEEEFKKWEW